MSQVRRSSLRFPFLGSRFGLPLALAAATAASTILFACGAGDPEVTDGVGTSMNGTGGATCETPNDGCPCETVGATTACGKVQQQIGDFVRCTMGTRTCEPSKTWGACAGELTVKTISLPQSIGGGGGGSGSGLHTSTLATSTSSCTSNACDPNCSAYHDTPSGLTVSDAGALTVNDSGLTLNPTGTFSLSSCTGLSITPSAPTLTVTSLSPVSPSTIAFSAALVPAGCYPGAANPIWTINDTRADSVTIAGSGSNATLTVVSPIAGPVTVRAYLGPFVATATATINVNVVDSTAQPAYATSFDPATVAADSLSILYPYPSTVFPLGLPPPIPQWKGASAAQSVKVSLRYTSGSTSFKWSAITAENATIPIVSGVNLTAGPRYPSIPASVWALFEKSARGADAQIVIQRIVSGSLKVEVPTTIHFANGQLKGHVFYQSYGTQLARNFLGGAIDSTSGSKVFPSGAFGAATLAIAPGATAPTVVAGSTNGNAADGSGTYCRVCHTASADGQILITQKYGSGNTTSQRYTNLTSASPAYVDMSPGDGRFAWPALFPTGGTTSGFLFSNAGPMASFTSGPPPGGLDGSNSSLTSVLYSAATGSLGSSIAATYRTSGASPITINLPSSGWGLQGAVPSFSATGAKVAMQHHAGKVCATGTATQCTTAELTAGDKRSLAVMDFNSTTKQFSNFKIINAEPNAVCNSTFHPSQPCFDVWPTFMPNDTGLVYEREIFNNGNVGGSGSNSDFGGTRAGCDSSATCNNDGTKAELWWVNLSGSASPQRLNAANGRTSGGASYLPVGSDASTYCRVGGFSCSSNAQCCSGTCSNSRCTALKRSAGTGCSAASDCESNKCTSSVCGCARDSDCAAGTCNTSTGACSTGTYIAAPTMSYVPGHNATVEPVLNYEPTVNPTPTYDSAGAAEYYWVVFTSRRMFGNIATIDPWWSDPRRQDISQTVTPKKLWVAAIRANPTAGTDPSYPAFYLPGQEWVSGNSKAYWVQNACIQGNATPSVSTECESSLDCCSGSTCQLATPVSNPAKRYCVPAMACVNAGGACTQSTDCCSGRVCSSGTCQDPPPINYYGAGGTYSRDFVSPCITGFKPLWAFLDYQAVLPAGTSIVFNARTGPNATAAAAASPLVSIGTALPPSTTGWATFPTNIEALLKGGGGQSDQVLHVEMTLNPTADATAAPTLTSWRVSVDCVPRE